MNNKVFEHIARSDTLVEVVIQQITTAIVTGKLEPGDKLVETHLADQLGVSRAPLREAFRHLESTGLVEKFPNRGTFVSKLTRQDVEELHAVREPLEGLAARTLASMQKRSAIITLESILAQMRLTAEQDNQHRMIELDADFHDALILLTENKLLQEVWQGAISQRLRRFLLLKRQRLYPALSAAAALHEPIIEAIARGDGDTAAREACHHVRDAGQNIGTFDE
jgi:DNA-binding GntR family transcriptional regulator